MIPLIRTGRSMASATLNFYAAHLSTPFFEVKILQLDCYPIYNQITAKRAPSHAENTFS
jgi:hypothetical protein